MKNVGVARLELIAAGKSLLNAVQRVPVVEPETHNQR